MLGGRSLPPFLPCPYLVLTLPCPYHVPTMQMLCIHSAIVTADETFLAPSDGSVRGRGLST